MGVIKQARRSVKKRYVKWRYANAQKIFCIGKNKTGTTSLNHLFKQLGYQVAPQKQAEALVFDWHENKKEKIIAFTRNNGQVFQDVPFSLDKTYRWLDEAFPDSKFILTIRDDAEQWYESLLRFHSKLWAKGKVPTKEDLQNATYRYKGYPWDAFKLINSTPEDDLYNKEILIEGYERHNREVLEYFTGRPEKLLIINLKDDFAATTFSQFLRLKNPIDSFPWKNKTSDLKSNVL